ncbi:MAG TPA: G1 family glutamic endopeptidase [Acidimicrobiales bacterium]|nr:G1 family glutamic endopeptidase [Acidimicrobiales bacterium]
MSTVAFSAVVASPAAAHEHSNPNGGRGAAEMTTGHVFRSEPNLSITKGTVVEGTSSSQSAARSSSVCWQSGNWSGYAVATAPPSGSSCSFPSSSSNPSYSGHYTSLSATWTVPTVTSGSSTYSSVWTGIDGFTNDDLIQAGTSQDYISGKASYFAWWEILPAADTTISSIAVDPGDSVTVSITKETSAIKSPATCSAGQWLITLTDNGSTSHSAQKEFATCQSYSGPATSAEYIVEAPEVNGSVATLADYASATLGAPSVLQVNGANVDLAAGTGGEMVQSSKVVSVPSEPDSAGDAITCAYSSSQPAAP